MTAPKVTVTIDAKDFTFWESIQITRSLDNFSTIELSAPFEPTDFDFRTMFVPFSYKSLEIRVSTAPGSKDQQVLFTGQLVGVHPRSTPASTTVRCSGYALPAVLADSTMPASEFPIEFKKMTLFQIADALAKPFGIPVRVAAGVSPGPQFKRIAIKPTQKVGAFLGELARARGLVMRDTATGELELLQSAPIGRPVASFREGQQPMISVAATFSPQSYYSEITGLARTKAGKKGSKYTERNEKLPDVVRPLNFTVGDVNAGDLPGAVKAKMARMFGNMVAYVVEVPTWYDPNGVLFEPNTTVTLHAPGAMVYEEVELLVRDVIFRADASRVSASLGLVLPGAFSGEQPPGLPWD